MGDLHLHTHFSDGSVAPTQLIDFASRANISHMAITDHDYFTITSELVSYAKNLGIQLIDGIEISSIDVKRGRKVHILCYFPKRHQLITTICNEVIARRVEAGKIMARRVAEIYPITIEEINYISRHSPCIYKQHIMHALMDAGHAVRIYGEMFSTLFDTKNGSCIVNFPQPDVHSVIRAIKDSGGVCVMAHPYTYNSIDLLNELCEQHLLDGVEVWSSKSNREQEGFLINIAKNHNIIPTGGSDFHGAYGSRPSPIGAKPTPSESISRLIGLSNQRN